jgi:hypothetical protein
MGRLSVTGRLSSMDLRDWMISDHAGVMGRFEQAIVAHVPPARWTEQADGGGTSIAALLHHLTRHQDLAVNVVVRGVAPIWAEYASDLGIADLPATVGLSETEDPALTARLDPEALMAYARAVHTATQTWLAEGSDDAELPVLLDAVPPTSARLEAAGVAAAAVPWLHTMWSDRTTGWLVQWPGVGHGHAHVGEATGVRNRLGLSPF